MQPLTLAIVLTDQLIPASLLALVAVLKQHGSSHSTVALEGCWVTANLAIGHPENNVNLVDAGVCEGTSLKWMLLYAELKFWPINSLVYNIYSGDQSH